MLIGVAMEGFTKQVFQGIDPTVDRWVTMGSPVPMLTIVLAYLVFVYWLGPKIMANRKPLDLKPALIAYNAFQVLWATYVLLLPVRFPGLIAAFQTDCHPSPTPRTHPGDLTEGHWAMDVAHLSWCFYASKIIDLLDTVFFVLRKKHRQISFLHVWHHAVIVPSSWAFLKYLQEPGFLPLTLLNTGVHAVMYTYYLISALGPQYARYIWWKKYMTRIQMMQFVLVVVYLGALWGFGCHISKAMATYIIVNNIILFGLFGNFYVKAYDSSQQKQKKLS